MPDLRGGKKHWYTRVFEIPWPEIRQSGPVRPGEQAPMIDDDAKQSLVVDNIGEVSGKTVHLTVFRDAWVYRFRRDLPAREIFDRIFGAGTGGIHVTLELSDTEGLHCYREGANQGRTDKEKRELAALLQRAIDRFTQKIASAQQTYEKFVWTDCDDPDQRLEHLSSDVRTDGLARIARMAGEACGGAHVVYPTQSDSALIWAGAAVHPLQVLQNTYQRQIRDACRGLDADARRDRESDGMSRFFHFQAVPPRPLGPPDPQRKTLDERMEEIESSLSTVGRYLDVAELDVIVKALKKARVDLKGVRRVFDAAPSAWTGGRDAYARRVLAIPALVEMDRKMMRARKALAVVPLTREQCESVQGLLAKAHRDLAGALQGVCSVQNFHSIEPFYLFRLMVKFDLRSTTAIPAGLRTKVSASATGLLHNSRHMAWLFEWLRDKLVELDRRLARACPVKGPKSPAWPDGEPAYCFYLKGGRAAKYAQGRGAEGENDWDTNIVINPFLRAGEWYATFAAVHNEVLRFLSDARRELTVEMYDAAHCEALQAALDDHQAATERAAREKREREEEERRAESSGLLSALGGLASALWGLAGAAVDLLLNDDDDELDSVADAQADLAPGPAPGVEIEEGEREGCKAELIDIGIPRRDTIEAFTQWMHVCPHVKRTPDGVPIPDHLYFVAEYALMIREAFADRSISVGKTPKRVMRLLEVLELEELDPLVNTEWDHHVRPRLIPKSAKKIGELDLPRRRMVMFLTVHLYLAYELAVDAGLSACFDALFSASIDAPERKAKYPKSLSDAIDAYAAEEARKPQSKQTPYAPRHKALADSIGHVQWLARRMDRHFREERAPFLLQHRGELERLVAAIYSGRTAPQRSDPLAAAGSVFAQHEELEVMLAITGAFAARLHAEYGRLEPERFDELEPIRRLELTVYARSGAKPEVALELVEPLVREYLANTGQGGLQLVAAPASGGTLCLTLAGAYSFSPKFTYKPVVVTITAVSCEENWPSLSFVRGLPVLNLRDLIWEYKRRAGAIEESYTQDVLRVASEALGDLLTRFENPNPGSLPPPTPQPPVPPQRDQAVQQQQPRTIRGSVDIDRIGQVRSNWCWAASSLIMRRFYLGDTATLEDVVREAFGELKNDQNALRLSRLQPTPPVERRTLEWSAVKRFVDDAKPFIVGNAGHYHVCYGYEEQGTRRTLLLWDPMGQGAEVSMPYATYERGTRERDWATACDFTIKERRAFIPLTVAPTAIDLGLEDAKVAVTLPLSTPAAVARAHLRIRAEKNSRGGKGAVLKVHTYQRRLPSAEGCGKRAMKLLRTLQPGDGTRFLLELEVELPEGEAWAPAEGAAKRALLTVKHP